MTRLPKPLKRGSDEGIRIHGTPGGETEGVRLFWDGVDERGWSRLLDRAERVPLEQAWIFGDALQGVSAYKPRRAIFLIGDRPVAMAQCFEWSILGAARIVKLTRGPIYLETVEPAQRRAIYRLLTDRWPTRGLNWFFLMPEEADGDCIAPLGKGRTATGYGTIWLDLSVGVEALRAGLHQKWRNQLRRGERSKLRVRSAQGGTSLEWVLDRHEAHRKRGRLSAPTGAFAALLCVMTARSKDILVLTAEDGSEPVAGVLFLRHGSTATYYVSWTSPIGRREQAHNLLVWRAIEALAADGVRWIDLGGIDASMAGVSRFKLGIGGTPVTLPGTWL